MRTKGYFPVLKKLFKRSSDHAREYGMKAEFIWSYKAARRRNHPIDVSCYIALDEWDL